MSSVKTLGTASSVSIGVTSHSGPGQGQTAPKLMGILTCCPERLIKDNAMKTVSMVVYSLYFMKIKLISV